MEPNTTPVVRCPRCDHPIDWHHSDNECASTGPANGVCHCRMTPNLIAVAAVQTALFGDLTPAPGTVRVSRQPDGSWA